MIFMRSKGPPLSMGYWAGRTDSWTRAFCGLVSRTLHVIDNKYLSKLFFFILKDLTSCSTISAVSEVENDAVIVDIAIELHLIDDICLLAWNTGRPQLTTDHLPNCLKIQWIYLGGVCVCVYL